MLHYPDAVGAHVTSASVYDQVMLGPELIVAPIFEKSANTRDVFLPPGSGKWKRLFAPPAGKGTAFAVEQTMDGDCTDPEQQCSLQQQSAPFGYPLVYVLEGGPHYDLLGQLDQVVQRKLDERAPHIARSFKA